MKKFFIILSLISTTSLTSSKADPLKDLAGSYRSLAEDLVEYSQSYSHKHPAQATERIDGLSQNLEGANRLVTVIDDYLEGTYSPDAVLSNLLDSRFQFLREVKVRHKLMRDALKMTGDWELVTKKFLVRATNHVFLRELKKLAQDEQDSFGPHTFNYHTTLAFIDRYQLVNKLIVGVYQRHSLSDFSTQTKRLLSASVTLHPLLTGKTDNCSHPDDGVLIDREDPEHLKAGKDIQYWEGCIKERKYPITLMNWGKHQTTILATAEKMGNSKLTLPYLGWIDFSTKVDNHDTEKAFPSAQENEIKSKSDLPKPALTKDKGEHDTGEKSSKVPDSLKLTKVPELPLSDEEARSEERVVLQEQDSEGSNKEAMVQSDSNPDTGLIAYPGDLEQLNEIDSKADLSTPPLTKEVDENETGEKSSEGPDRLKFSEAPELPSSEEEATTEESILVPQEQDAGDSDEEAAANSNKTTTEPISQTPTRRAEKKKRARDRRKQTRELSSPPTSSAPQDSGRYIAPRGHRVLHSKGFVEAKPRREVELASTSQRILDRIFDQSQFQKVKYREFKALWESVNGFESIKKPGNGGSHRTLLNAQGDVVGSTYTHGGNHTYSKNSIKYIRDALINVGLGQDTRSE